LEENLVFELKAHPPLNRLKSFQQGLFYVQDPSTLLAVKELEPKPGDTVLDLCAAPGGKLSYIAQLMANDGCLVAYDTSADRLKLATENCARLGVSCVETAAPDRDPALTSLFSRSKDRFDRVLVDAPCSNTGVMRRRVDLRWRINPNEINRLRNNQLQLLRQAAPLVKPGGTLVYSTCSMEPEENTQVVNILLAENPWLSLQNQRELTPFSDHNDGAFVACLRRQ
jgi:16S rRNA (cytosine967-C5)-methyltransferase